MDENFSGAKELFDINIRLLKPLEVNGRKYDVNESILKFERAEIAQIQENKKTVSAKGGYHNTNLVNWEIDREMPFMLTHGVLSPTSWSILSNSIISEPKTRSVQFSEEVQVIEAENYIFGDLKYCPNACDRLGAQPNPNFEPLPMGRRPELLLKPLPPSKTKWIFVYDLDTGKKITDFQFYQNRLYFTYPVKRIYVDYTFTYEDKIKVIEVGNRLVNGFLKLEGKMSVKEQNSGEVSTAILELPKIKLSSSLSIRLGSNQLNSTVSDFYFTGYPDENERRDSQKIANIIFLDKELTGDYI